MQSSQSRYFPNSMGLQRHSTHRLSWLSGMARPVIALCWRPSWIPHSVPSSGMFQQLSCAQNSLDFAHFSPMNALSSATAFCTTALSGYTERWVFWVTVHCNALVRNLSLVVFLSLVLSPLFSTTAVSFAGLLLFLARAVVSTAVSFAGLLLFLSLVSTAVSFAGAK